MKAHPHIHFSPRLRRPHRISFIEKINLSFFLPFLIIVGAVFVTINISNDSVVTGVSYSTLFGALFSSFVRLVVSYIFALIFGVGLALCALRSRLAERILLPIYDVIESVPVLVFFPIIIIFFVRYDFLNLAAIFIIFLNMLWNIVFSVISGAKLIPINIMEVGHVFKIRGFRNFFSILLPALTPAIITGSLLAFGEGWNMLIVAEVLHTYVPTTTHVNDLFGIGSLLVNASASNNQGLFLAAVVAIIASITLLNVFVWQKLLLFAEKFKFD